MLIFQNWSYCDCDEIPVVVTGMINNCHLVIVGDYLNIINNRVGYINTFLGAARIASSLMHSTAQLCLPQKSSILLLINTGDFIHCNSGIEATQLTVSADIYFPHKDVKFDKPFFTANGTFDMSSKALSNLLNFEKGLEFTKGGD